MKIKNLWNKVKPYMFSNSIIYLLKRSRNDKLINIESKAIVKKIESEKDIKDILMAEPEQDITLYNDLYLKGDLLFYAYNKGEYVGRGLVDINETELSYLRAWKFDLPKDSAYIHRLYVAPEMRGKHIAQKIIFTICEYLYDKDIYSLVLKKKPQSLKTFFNNGFISIKSVRIIYIFFIPIVWIKNL